MTMIKKENRRLKPRVIVGIAVAGCLGLILFAMTEQLYWLLIAGFDTGVGLTAAVRGA